MMCACVCTRTRVNMFATQTRPSLLIDHAVIRSLKVLQISKSPGWWFLTFLGLGAFGKYAFFFLGKLKISTVFLI